ncbi:MAG: hypothetical protein LKI25_07985 [Atopobiaceae bacterium]|nr:hypothetical protein [Atopobiaceae bacterium]MCI2174125.1 hypothetical protein [Atopobiaceae bacterium]MCI2206766.1 hypothetical protein [Atopobiaceae bacterium]
MDRARLSSTSYPIPISVYFIWYVCGEGMITGWDWVWGILFVAVSAGVCVAFMTYAVFATRKTAWPFAPEEMARFDVEGKVEARGVAIESQEDAKGPFVMLRRLQCRLHPNG